LSLYQKRGSRPLIPSRARHLLIVSARSSDQFFLWVSRGGSSPFLSFRWTPPRTGWVGEGRPPFELLQEAGLPQKNWASPPRARHKHGSPPSFGGGFFLSVFLYIPTWCEALLLYFFGLIPFFHSFFDLSWLDSRKQILVFFP